MRTKVVGVTFSNEDGSSRARIIAGMSESDQICLERDPYNPYDANAVKVCVVKNGSKKQIGFLSKDIASDISSKLRRNVTFSVYVASVGIWNDRPFCELDITENSAPTTTTTTQRPVATTGPTFNPTRTTTTSAPSPTFNPTRTTTTSAPSPNVNPSKSTTSNTPKPSISASSSTSKNSGNNTSNNSGCFGIIVGIIVVISAILMY